MRSCCAVYVDVGYLLAAAATRVTGSSLRRGIQADYETLITWLSEHAEADSGLPLLRVNWYDAGGRPGGMPDASQDAIGRLPQVKLRLGRLSYSGEQKGVDVRIGLDLAIQARQRVADVVYLVSGDDDLTEAVEDAQSHGVQVVLLAVPRHDEQPLAVSKHLLREVDRTLVIDQAAIDAAFKPTAIPEALIPSWAADGETGEPGHGSPSDAEGSPADPTTPAVPAADTATPDPAAGPTDAASPGAEARPVPGPPRHRRRTVRVSDTADASENTQAAAPKSSSSDGPTAPSAAAPSAVSPVSPAAGKPQPGQTQAATASAGDTTPSPAATTSGATPPTPAMFARRKAEGVALPDAADVPPPPDEGVTLRVIDHVARQVVAAWCGSADPVSLAALKTGAPIIPPELDRALLVDLAARSDDDVLDDEARHEVRARFWYHVGRVRPV